MKLCSLLIGILAFACGFVVLPAWGAQGAVELEPMVVTATKTEKKASEAPASVTVIGREEFEKKNIQTVDDALNSIAGVFVKRSKGLMDTTASVRLRGFNNDRYTLVLMDGQPLNDAYTGAVDWGTLPVKNIERIEVVRGPVSALYGQNAMGGVINIITRDPQKLELSLSGGYGTNNTRRACIGAGNRFGKKIGLRVDYEQEVTDGYEATPVVRNISSGTGNVPGGYLMNDKYGEPSRWVVGDKGRNGAERWVLSGKMSLDYSDTGRLAFNAVSGDYEYDYGPPNTYMGTFGDNSTYAISGSDRRARFRPNDFISYTGIGERKTSTYTMALEDICGPLQLNAQVGTVLMESSYTLESGSGLADYYNSPGSLKKTEGQSWFGELRSSMTLGQFHMVTLGLSYRTDQADTNEYEVPFYRSYAGRGPSTYYSGGDSKAWAVFAQDQWLVSEALTVYLGLRYDAWKVYDGRSGVPGAETEYDSNSESQFSPRLAAVFKVLPDTTLRASAGYAFRPPTIYELYRTWQFYSTTYQSNPNLRPETVRSYELGFEQYFFGKKTRISLTGYRNDIDDMIYYRTEGSAKIRTNTGKARTYGLEIEVAQQVAEWMTLWANFTYTDARITDNPTDPESEDKQVVGIPETAWNIGLDAVGKWLRVSLAGSYYSKIYNDTDNRDTEQGVYGTYEPAFLLDAKVAFTPNARMQISLSVDNVFDEHYYEYYQTEGRSFLGQISFQY